MTEREKGWTAREKTFGGLTVFVLAAALVKAFFFPAGPAIVANGPPVIIHGGSMHADVVAPQAGPPYTTQAPDMTAIAMNGYGGTTPHLAYNWEIDVCDELNTDGSGSCGSHGFKVCSLSNCSTSGNLASPAPGTLTLGKLSDPHDSIAPGLIPQQFNVQNRYRLLDQNRKPDSYHPKYIVITQNQIMAPAMSCTPISPSSSWVDCWVALGAPVP